MILATLVELSHCRLTQIKGHSTLLSNKIELKTFPGNFLQNVHIHGSTKGYLGTLLTL